MVHPAALLQSMDKQGFGDVSGKTNSYVKISEVFEHKIVIMFLATIIKVSKVAKIRNQYNQVPHLTQDTNGKVTISQLDTTNESQEVSSFPVGDHKEQINRRTQRHDKHKTEKT